MEWIITGIIFFLIELYVISHTYESEYGLIKRASYPEDRETTCVIWRLKFDKFTKSVITKLSNLLNKEL